MDSHSVILLLIKLIKDTKYSSISNQYLRIEIKEKDSRKNGSWKILRKLYDPSSLCPIFRSVGHIEINKY